MALGGVVARGAEVGRGVVRGVVRAVGLGVGLGVGRAVGLGVGFGVAAGFGVGAGVGRGVAVGLGVGGGVGVGLGVGCGEIVMVGPAMDALLPAWSLASKVVFQAPDGSVVRTVNRTPCLHRSDPGACMVRTLPATATRM